MEKCVGIHFQEQGIIFKALLGRKADKPYNEAMGKRNWIKVMIRKLQSGLKMRKNNTDAMFAFRVLIETYIDGQKELHCVDQATKQAGVCSKSVSEPLLACIGDGQVDRWCKAYFTVPYSTTHSDTTGGSTRLESPCDSLTNSRRSLLEASPQDQAGRSGQRWSGVKAVAIFFYYLASRQTTRAS